MRALGTDNLVFLGTGYKLGSFCWLQNEGEDESDV